MPSSPSTSTSVRGTPRAATCLRSNECASVSTPSQSGSTSINVKSPSAQPKINAATFKDLPVQSSRLANKVPSREKDPVITSSPAADTMMLALQSGSDPTMQSSSFSSIPQARSIVLSGSGAAPPYEAGKLDKRETQPIAKRWSPSRKRSPPHALNTPPTTLAPLAPATTVNLGSLDTDPDWPSTKTLQSLFPHVGTSKSFEDKDDTEPSSSRSILADDDARGPAATPTTDDGHDATTTDAKTPESLDTSMIAPQPHRQQRQSRFGALPKERVSTCNQRQGFSVSLSSPIPAYPSVLCSAATLPRRSLTCSLAPAHTHSRGTVGTDSTTSWMTVDHFSTAPEVQNGQRYSKVTSPFSLGISSTIDDGVRVTKACEGNTRSPLSDEAAESIVPESVDTVSSSRRASDPSDSITSTKTRATAAVLVSVSPFVRADSPNSQTIYSVAPTASAASSEEQLLRTNQIVSHAYVSSQHPCSLSSGALKSLSPPTTFAHSLVVASSVESCTRESARQSVRGNKHTVSPSNLFSRQTGTPGFSSSPRMHHCRTSEDVYGEVYGRSDDDCRRDRHGIATPPPPPPPPCTLPLMLNATAPPGSGFARPASTGHEHNCEPTSDASEHDSVFDTVFDHGPPVQDGTESRPHPPSPLVAPSCGACTASIPGEESWEVDPTKTATALSVVESALSSINISNTQRILIDDPTSHTLSQPNDRGSDENTSLSLTQRSPQSHTSGSDSHTHGSALKPIHSVRASAQQLSASEVDAIPFAEVSPTGLHPAGAGETSVAKKCNRDPNNMSSIANEHRRTNPGMGNSARDPSSTFATSPTSVTAASARALSDPNPLCISSRNLTAPVTTSGTNPTHQLRQLGSSETHSKHSEHDNFVMRPDAEVLQGCLRGKVPRMPGCSMRDWTAHLSAKEDELRRKEKFSPSHTHQHGNNLGTLHIGGAALHARPGSTSASRFAQLPRMTPQEVATHNTPDDMWIVIHDIVYDCTVFQRYHPGGERLLLLCAGHDATAVYDRFHAWVSCESFMAPYAVGVLLHTDSW